MSIFQMDQLSDEEIDHGAEEDSDKEDQDLDKMFGAWLGELDKLTQVRNSGLKNCSKILNHHCVLKVYCVHIGIWI